MFTKLNIVVQRLERQAISKESACQQLQSQADVMQADICALRQQRGQMQQHLTTLLLSGATTLASLLEFKGQQATIQRRLAEMDVQLAEQQLQQQQLQQQLDSLRAERNVLQKKLEKMTEHIRRWRLQQQQGRQRQQDSETEEQRHWQR